MSPARLVGVGLGAVALVLAGWGSASFALVLPALVGVGVLAVSLLHPRLPAPALITPLAALWWTVAPAHGLLVAALAAGCLLGCHVAIALADGSPEWVHLTPAARRRIGLEVLGFAGAVAAAIGLVLLAVAEAGAIIPRGWPFVVAAVILLLGLAIAADRYRA